MVLAPTSLIIWHLRKVVNAQSVAFVQAVLMAGNTAQRGGHAIDGKATVRGDGVAAHTNIDVQIIIGFCSAAAGNYGVQVGFVHAPQLRIRHIQGNGGVIAGRVAEATSNP